MRVKLTALREHYSSNAIAPQRMRKYYEIKKEKYRGIPLLVCGNFPRAVKTRGVNRPH